MWSENGASDLATGRGDAFGEARKALESMVGRRVRFVVSVARGGGPAVAQGTGVLLGARDGESAPQEEEGLYFPLAGDDSLGFYLPAEGVWRAVDHSGAVDITIDNCQLSVWPARE